MSDNNYFVPIIEANKASSVGRNINIIGIISLIKFPQKSRGTDWYVTINVVDESSPNHGMAVTIFEENSEKLPLVELTGDIIQLSHVVIQSYKGDVCAYFNKTFSGFALFEGKHGKTYFPYKKSKRFFSRDQDKKIIDGLRKWSASNPPDGGIGQAVSLRDIKVGVQQNVMCKVLHVCEDTDDNWIVFVWDGTDTPTTAIQTSYWLEEEKDKSLLLQLEVLLLSRDILCTFPAAGTTLRVFIDKSSKLNLKCLRTGEWVVFVGINFEVDAGAGLWRGNLGTDTKLRLLSDADPLITQLQMDYDERYKSKWGRMPFSNFCCYSRLTQTDHGNVPFVTLMDILTHPEVTAKFRCVVRVVAVLPCRAEDFRCPHGICRIRLTLEDPTARIYALLYAEDGEKFFGSNSSVAVMRTMQNKLIGVVDMDDGEDLDAPRNPPWIDCCIKSYYVDEANVWETRKYRIFDTKMVQC